MLATTRHRGSEPAARPDSARRTPVHKGGVAKKRVGANTPASAAFRTGLDGQHAYVRALRGQKFDLIIAPTFLRGIRRSGYLSTATALYELIDNSIEAQAKSVQVLFGFADSLAKPAALAVFDDGHGMEPSMLKVALAWGGTHRENSRKGFGRFGYGLPTACMSQGRRFSVYSKTPSGRLQRVVLDLDELTGAKKAPTGADLIAPAVVAKLPSWLESYIAESHPQFLQKMGHGTVVVIEKLDNISWKTSVALERNLDRAIGVTYRHFLRTVRIHLQGARVRGIDPLFSMRTARYFDLDSDRAERVPWHAIEVRSDKSNHAIKVRAAYFPPTFARVDKAKEAAGLNANDRFPIMKENNGIIVMRLGRQVDVVSSGLWTQFQHNDRYWAIELDFPAELDEWFAITTNKQHINLTEPLREALRKGGLPELVEVLRTRYKKDRQALVPIGTVSGTISATVRPPAATAASNGQLPVASVEGGTFYLVRDNVGAVLNDKHPFFGRMYSDLAGRSDPKAALEAILTVLAQTELNADPDGKRFYREERRKWSKVLEAHLRDDTPLAMPLERAPGSPD